MKKFFTYLEQLQQKNKLTKTQLYLSVFGILLFLSLAITLPNYLLNQQQIFRSQAATITLPGPATLISSGPVTATTNGQVIENLRITSTNGDAITVDGHDDVIIRNVEIFHSGGHGIYIHRGDRTKIENVNIIHTGAPASGQNPGEFNNILCNGAQDVTINHARLRDGSTGVYTWECPRVKVTFIEGYDFRGPFPRGQIVQFGQNSNDAILEDFYNKNDINKSWTEDNVNIWRSSNAIIRRGLIDGNNSPSGVGIIFEHDDDIAHTGLVEDVDTIRMGNGSFSGAHAKDVTFRRVRARENICGDLAGRGPSLSNSLMFHSYQNQLSYGIRYEQAKYWASCNGNIAWDQSTMQTADFQQENFTLREPIKLVFSWEQTITPTSADIPTPTLNPSQAPDASPVGWWKFDEGSGTTATDTSGNNNTATLVNGTTWTTGKINSATSFDGVDDAVTIPASTDYDTASFSTAFWIKPLALRAGNEYANIIMGRENYQTKGFRFGLKTAGNPVFWTSQSGGSLSLVSSTTTPTNNFSHLVVAYDGSVGKIYINGIERASAQGTYVPPAGLPLTVNGGIGGTQSSNSVIDDVRWYNRALTPSEVQTLANPTNPTFIPTPTLTPTPTNTPIPTPTFTPTPTPVSPGGNGLTGAYFSNRTLSGSPTLVRVDPAVNFNWATGRPATSLPTDNFSVRWTGYVRPQYSQQYTFYTQSDDGVRLWVNGTRIINNWTDHSSTENSGKITLTAGQKYTIKLEYYERGGQALIQLRWSSPSQTKQIIPQSRLFSQ